MFKKLILSLALVLAIGAAFGQEFPAKPSTLVSDYTNTLTEDQKAQLEQKLVAFDDSTSVQVAVVMMQSTGDYDINEYAALLGRKWGVGQKDKNNGVVVLVALKDHKMSIQTGYGSEGMLPDAITHQIIENDMKPNFKQGDFFGGLNAAVDDIIRYNKGEYKNDHPRQKVVKQDDGGPAGFIIIIVIFILILVFRRRGGGGGNIIGGRGSASPFWWFLAGSMMNGGNRGGGWGGGSSGSGWSGGGSSGGGGGFGGFGGGSFGGGGSSGSW